MTIGQMIFCIDFDGTITELGYPEIGKEKIKAIETIIRLQRAGHKIVIWTVREGKRLKEAVEWLKSRGVFPDFVNFTRGCERSTFETPDIRKFDADYFLDDKSFPPFSGWEEFSKWAENIGIL